MGYNIQQNDGKFEIKSEQVPKATHAFIQAINDDAEGTRNFVWMKEQLDLETLGQPTTCQTCNQKIPSDHTALKDLTTLMDKILGFGIETEDGNVISVFFDGQKRFSGLEWGLQIIAPFVTQGSFLEFSGEDAAQWRYNFNGKTMTELKAKVVWEK